MSSTNHNLQGQYSVVYQPCHCVKCQHSVVYQPCHCVKGQQHEIILHYMFNVYVGWNYNSNK
jgi:hypothetical protein